MTQTYARLSKAYVKTKNENSIKFNVLFLNRSNIKQSLGLPTLTFCPCDVYYYTQLSYNLKISVRKFGKIYLSSVSYNNLRRG